MIDTPDLNALPDDAYVEKKLPLMMHRSGTPTIIGEATIQKYKDHSEIHAVITNADGMEMVSLLLSGLADSVTLGGTIDPRLLKNLN